MMRYVCSGRGYLLPHKASLQFRLCVFATVPLLSNLGADVSEGSLNLSCSNRNCREELDKAFSMADGLYTCCPNIICSSNSLNRVRGLMPSDSSSKNV